MNDRERQDVFVFVGVLIVGALIALSIAIASHAWSSTSWTAIGAIGSCAQALAVTSGLLYAGRQWREAHLTRVSAQRRSEAERARAAVERLSAYVRGEFGDVIEAALEAIRHVEASEMLLRLYRDDDEEAIAIRARQQDQRTDLRSRLEQLDVAAARNLGLLAGVAAAAVSTTSLADVAERFRSLAKEARRHVTVSISKEPALPPEPLRELRTRLLGLYDELNLVLYALAVELAKPGEMSA